ncbi:hypothetical protein J4477_03100 [Candidatus Pacearchaeota archaeon]|nr:hypothetical protein [uncultured archaeon]MBS3072794.1 hypothetical protein [Candidatus Pacearchaeota archaeon]
MGLFSRKKEKKEAAEIPQLPKLPPLPFQNTNKIQDITAYNTENSYNSTILPSFPNSNLGNKINQSAIKEAIGSSESNKLEDEEEFSQMTPSIIPQIPQSRPRSLEISDWQNQNTETRVKKAEPIFVKLEKYEGALSTFNEIRLRIGEIDSMLKDIREVKKREETELEEWENEIETIKARLDQIDKEMFNRL